MSDLFNQITWDVVVFKINSVEWCFTSSNKSTLFDFTKIKSVDNWIEVSDTVREVGKSKATFVLQTTQIFQKAIFFTLLNPQPNGAGFAGVKVSTNLDLSQNKKLAMKCKAQGQCKHYKMVLEHNGRSSNLDVTYENIFEVKHHFMEVFVTLQRQKVNKYISTV